MLIFGVAALVLAPAIDDLEFLKPFNAGPYSFFQAAGISSVMGVITRYLVLGITCNSFSSSLLVLLAYEVTYFCSTRTAE